MPLANIRMHWQFFHARTILWRVRVWPTEQVTVQATNTGVVRRDPVTSDPAVRLTARNRLGIFDIANVYRDSNDDLWPLGALGDDSLDDDDPLKFAAGRWDPDTKTIVPAWTVSSPAPIASGDPFGPANWGGIWSACDDGSTGMYAVVPQRLGGFGVNVPTVVHWDGSSSTATSATGAIAPWARGTKDYDLFSLSQTLYAEEDISGGDRTSAFYMFNSVPLLLVHAFGYYYMLTAGGQSVPPPYTPIPAGLMTAFWRMADTGDPSDPAQWTNLYRQYAPWVIGTFATDPGYGQQFGPLDERVTDLWWGPVTYTNALDVTYLMIARGMAVHTSYGYTPPFLINIYFIYPTFTDYTTMLYLTPAYTTSRQQGPIFQYGAAVYMLTLDEWGVDLAPEVGESATLRLWEWHYFADVDGDYYDFLHISSYTRLQTEWGSPLISSAFGDPDSGYMFVAFRSYNGYSLGDLAPLEIHAYAVATDTWTTGSQGTLTEDELGSPPRIWAVETE